MATFDNIDRYVYFHGTANPTSGGRGDGVGVSTCVLSFDSRNQSASAIANHLVAASDGVLTISDAPPTSPVVIHDDDVVSIMNNIKSYRTNEDNKHADYKLNEYLEGAFDIDEDEVLPQDVDTMSVIMLTNKYGISVDGFIEYVATTHAVLDGMTSPVDGILTEAELDLDWSNPQILEGFVARASVFIAEEKRKEAERKAAREVEKAAKRAGKMSKSN